MNQYNVLILSAGRRVELIQLFKSAAKKLNINSKVIAADCTATAPALYFSDDTVILPKISSEKYISEIIDTCIKNEVKLIVPTIDTDLLLLSQNKEEILKKSGATVMISDEKVISICRDKIKTQTYLEENGFKIPKMYSREEINTLENIKYPLFIKPISGSSSINTFKVNNKKELDIYLDLIEDPIVQDFIEGEEYTVDVFLDFKSNPITIVPRQRLAVRGGEISKGIIRKDSEIIADIKILVEKLKPIGHITIQLMKTAKGIEYIEINPRFGGGAPMSIQSGANSCENLYHILQNKSLEYNENYEENLLFLRYDSSICLDKDMRIVND